MMGGHDANDGKAYTLGEKLRLLRTANCMTQLELANVIHVHQSTITTWELDLKTPSAVNISRLCKIFCIEPDELIGAVPRKDFQNFEALITNLKRLREAKGMSQAELAGMLGIHYTSLNNIESGKRRPNVKTVKRMADILGVSVSSLFESYVRTDTAADNEKRDVLSKYKTFGQRARKEASSMTPDQRKALVATLMGIVNGIRVLGV